MSRNKNIQSFKEWKFGNFLVHDIWAELQPSSVRGGEDFNSDFTFVHDHFFNNFQLINSIN